MKILIVEDEFRLAEALAQTMKNEGHSASVAADGKSGLDEALTDVYDVILLDVMLPKMNGYDVLKTMRQENINTPVIMLTAKSELEDKLEGFSCGADDYLTKPFEMKELLARMGAVCNRKAPAVSNNLDVGDLCLYLKKGTITSKKSGKTVNVSKKEQQLLEYLMQNRGQVVSRSQITVRVWGFDSEAEYNNVDVYISFLRKKLQFVETSAKIKAVRGLGYLLEDLG